MRTRVFSFLLLLFVFSPARGDRVASDESCYTPARGPKCPRVRFGWGNCPGSRQACDWCYSPDGHVFAYSPRTSVYSLTSGCDQLGSSTIWSTTNEQIVQRMKDAGGKCNSDGHGGFLCTNVDSKRYKDAQK
jgi:hypothetical protein